MAGILDLIQSEDPAIQNGLLNFGLSLLRSKGNFGNAVGQAGVAGQLGARDYRQQEALLKRTGLTDQLLQMQLEHAKRQQQGEQAAQDYFRTAMAPVQPIDLNAASGVTGPRPEALNAVGKTPGFNLNAALTAGVPLQMALQLQQAVHKQEPDVKAFKPGEVAGYIKDGKFVETLRVPDKADKPATAIEEYNFAKQQGYAGTFQQWVTEKARAGASNNSVVNYGSPVPIDLGNGSIGYAQPPNRAGAAPQVMTDPATGKPMVKPAENKQLPEAANKQLVGARNVQDAVGDYVKELGTWNNAKMLIPNERAKMGTAYNNMMLQAKEAYNLGVLNGPDYQILQSVVKDPTKPGSALTSNEAMKEQALELSRIAKRIESRVLEAHGKAATDTQKKDVRRFDAQGNQIQ